MNPRRRRVLTFALAFLPLFVIAVWLYPKVVPTYQRAVFGAANAVLAIPSPPVEVRATPTGRWQILVHRPRAEHVVTLGTRKIGVLAFFQLVVLSPLLLATPVPVRGRLRLLACGIGLMFCFHVLCVAGCAFGMALIDNPTSEVFQSLPILLGPFASGLAVVTWALLTWRDWLSLFDRAAFGESNKTAGPKVKRSR